MDEIPRIAQLFAFEPRARRLELLVRIVYPIAIGLVMWIYGLIAGICLVVQWLLILVFGRRNESLSEFIGGTSNTTSTSSPLRAR